MGVCSALRGSALVLVLAAHPGCSLFLTRGPEPEVRPPRACTTSSAAPVADTVLAALSLGVAAYGVYGLSSYHSCGVPQGDSCAYNDLTAVAAGTIIALGLVSSAVFTSSAVTGYERTAACRESLKAPAPPERPQAAGSSAPGPPSARPLCRLEGDAPRACAAGAVQASVGGAPALQ